MLQLVSARFNNYRLLRDFEVEFSLNPSRPLTVVRAENESGKTTFHTALQWVLYGDQALPTASTDGGYRLHPIDWDVSADGADVEISGEISFRFTRLSSTPTGGVEEHAVEEYVLRRTCQERLDADGNFSRFHREPTLLKRTPAGYEPVETNPAALIEEMIPISLKEIFFTDGDRALAFIQASQGARRERVENAIRSLLGLELIETAERHVLKALTEIRKRISQEGGDSEIGQLTTRLNTIDEQLAAKEEERKQAHASVSRLEEEITKYNELLVRALVRGDREELSQQLKAAEARRNSYDAAHRDRVRAVADLFSDATLPTNLLYRVVEETKELLEPLHQQGRIPSTFVPLIKERLTAGVCICGTPLLEGTKERQELEAHLVERAEDDALHDRLAQLYYRIDTLLDATATPRGYWISQLQERSRLVDDATRALSRSQEEMRDLQVKLDQVPDTDVAELRRQSKAADEHRRDEDRKATLAEADIKRLSDERTQIDSRRDQVLRMQGRFQLQRASERATEDLLSVLQASMAVLKGQKLRDVSAEMNRLFLQMIVADPDQKSIIREASITPEYDIVVTGVADRRLDPDVDLNGASRRALTIAFILALTKVSETQAPSIIDTPLGMTSGAVKRAILQTGVDEASQLVLLLTRDEISGTSDILDSAVGSICTFSNTAHHPGQLVNNPPYDDLRVMVCACDHNHFCGVCERQPDAQNPALQRRA